LAAATSRGAGEVAAAASLAAAFGGGGLGEIGGGAGTGGFASSLAQLGAELAGLAAGRCCQNRVFYSLVLGNS
jgi:hypothetical protein